MSKKTIKDYLNEASIDPSAATWEMTKRNKDGTIKTSIIVLHAALEELADFLGITFESPVFINTDYKTKANGTDKWGNIKVADDSHISILVSGSWKDKKEWSTGEYSPANSSNSFPYAIAEKRAKDRVILKLLRVHGEVYSDAEAEAFKREKSKGKPNTQYNTTDPKAHYSQPINTVVNNMPKFVPQPDMQDIGY